MVWLKTWMKIIISSGGKQHEIFLESKSYLSSYHFNKTSPFWLLNEPPYFLLGPVHPANGDRPQHQLEDSPEVLGQATAPGVATAFERHFWVVDTADIIKTWNLRD